jgi:hypothetical protein
LNWTFDNLNSKLQILRHCSSVVSFFYVENHLWQQIYHIHNIKSSHRLDKDRKRNIIYMKNIINCEDIVQVYNIVIKDKYDTDIEIYKMILKKMSTKVDKLSYCCQKRSISVSVTKQV